MSNDYNFERSVNRHNKYSLKWDLYKGQDILPLWVADMDFAPAPEIKEAIHKYADDETYGYAVHPEELTDVLIKRMKRLYNWDTQAEDYVFIEGVVPALNVICRALSNPGSTIINFTPVYYPFLRTPANSGLNVLNIPLLQDNEGWRADLEAFRRSNVKEGSILQFCSPHNPVGKMFTFDELNEIGKICEDKNIVIASDEIHCDLLLDQTKTHIPIATVSKKLSDRTITLMSPTKTWSIPGIQFSFMIIKNHKIKNRMTNYMSGLFGRLSGVSNMAALAAFKSGDEWLNRLLPVLRENRDIVIDALKDIPGIKVSTPLEATYLAWVDCRNSGIADMKGYLEKHAQVGVSDGKAFGGDGFIRINFACQQPALKPAMEKIRKALIEKRT